MTKRLSLARFGAILSYGVAALVNFRAFQNRLVECRMSGAVGALLAAGTGLCIWLFPWGDGLERWSYDLLFLSKRVQAPPEAVIVLLDDMSYSQLGQKYRQPWDRRLHAQLLEHLQAAGARAVVFDILFDEAGADPMKDQELARAMSACSRGVLSGELVEAEDSGRPSWMLRPPLDLFGAAAAGWGLSGLSHDAFYALRRIYPGTPEVPSLAWKALEVADVPLAKQSGAREAGRWLNHYGPGGTLLRVPYWQSFVEGGIAPEFFRNKVVFVGSWVQTGFAGEAKDSFHNPYTLWTGKSVPGVETHATAFLNLARGEWLKRPAWWIEALGLASIAVVLGYAFALLRPWAAAGLAVGAVILTALLAVAFFLSCYVWFPWLDVAVVQVPVAWTSSVLFHFVQLHTQKRLLEQSLSLHLAPARVEQLLRQPELRRPGGSQLLISILFSDIARFSRVSGRMHPDDLARLLNHYFQVSLDIVHRNEGVVVKLIGDAIFAIWNAPVAQADHSERACLAALQLRDQLIRFDAAHEGLPLRTRIGLHSGMAFVGNIGSEARFDYTAIGESVNLASRVEGLNKHLGTAVLATRDIQKAVEQKMVSRLAGYFRLQGFDRVVEIHELVAPAVTGQPAPDWCPIFVSGIHQFARRDFAGAEAAFNRTLELHPEDGPSLFYLKKIAELRGQLLPDDWTGEVDLKEK